MRHSKDKPRGSEEARHSNKKNKEAHPVPLVSRAPKPPRRLRFHPKPTRPKPTQMPRGWELYFPEDLVPLTTVIIGKAIRKFSDQTQTLPLCKYVVFELTPHLCARVQRKTLRADEALSKMSNVLHCLSVYNCDDSEASYRVEQDTIGSNEWLKLAEGVHSAAEKGGGRTDRRGVPRRRRRKRIRPGRVPLPAEKRASTVARIIKELNDLKPKMHGESEYERLARKNPRFLTFRVADKHGELKEKVINVQAHRRHIRLAQELAAAYHRKQFSTIQTDWKKHKPKEFRYKLK